MENALRASPQDVREQYEQQLKALQEAYGEAMLELRARKKNCSPCWARTNHDRDDPPGTQRGWLHRLDCQLCRWFDIPRRTVYYRPTRKTPQIQERFGSANQA